MKAKFDPAKLGEDARTSYDIWALELDRDEKDNAWRRHRYIFDRNGAHTGLPNFLINAHRVDSRPTWTPTSPASGKIGVALDQLLERAKLAAAGGVRMPRFAYDQSLDEIARLNSRRAVRRRRRLRRCSPTPRPRSPLSRPPARSTRPRPTPCSAGVTAAMTGQMKPAYDRLAAWLTADRDQRLGRSPRASGALPNGARLLRRHALPGDHHRPDRRRRSTSSASKEVARIHAEMETLKTKIGFTGSLQDFFVFMRTDKRFYLPNTDAGRAAVPDGGRGLPRRA